MLFDLSVLVMLNECKLNVYVIAVYVGVSQSLSNLLALTYL